MLYNNLPKRSIWNEFDRLEREVGRLFDAYTGMMTPAPDFPAMNIWINDQGAVVTAELPGIEPRDLDIKAVGGTLTISGERTPEKTREDTRIHRQERDFGKFVRSVEMPFTIQADKVDAKLEKGILNIYAPRLEAEIPRKIAVRTS